MLDLDDFEEHEFDEEEIRIRHEQKQREEQLAAEKKRLLASYSDPVPGMNNRGTDENNKNNEHEPEGHNYRWIIIVVAIIGTVLLGWLLAEYGGKILMGICVIIWLIAEFLIYPFKRK